jgi:AAA domain
VAEVREDLGVFESGFASWSRILSISANDEVRLQNFRNAALEAVYYVGKGLNKSLAADELFDLAHSHGLADMVGEDVIQQIIADAFEPPQPNGNGAAHAYTEAEPPPQQEPPRAPPVKHATLYVAPDPATIPKRAWLLGGHYIRQAATATVAPGGFGKTTLTLYEAITMAAGGLKVWYLSGEDPRVEIDRRIAAHCQHHGIDLAALPGQLYMDDRQSFNLSIGTSTRPGVVKFNDQSLKMFETAIGVDELDVVMLDPFISFHGVSENDNNSIDAVVKQLGNIAQRTNCCIEISHHVRKPGQGQFASLTIDDARGGGAIINAVRSGRVINRMTGPEAERAHIEDEQRHFYIRVDRGKRNMAPPDKANWMHLASVMLPNGDAVGVLEVWEFPKVLDNVSVEDTDWVRELVRRQAYRTDARSPKWLGVEIARRFHKNVHDRLDCIWINKLIGLWLIADPPPFKKMELRDPEERKKRWFYVGLDANADEREPAKVVSLFPTDDDDHG